MNRTIILAFLVIITPIAGEVYAQEVYRSAFAIGWPKRTVGLIRGDSIAVAINLVREPPLRGRVTNVSANELSLRLASDEITKIRGGSVRRIDILDRKSGFAYDLPLFRGEFIRVYHSGRQNQGDYLSVIPGIAGEADSLRLIQNGILHSISSESITRLYRRSPKPNRGLKGFGKGAGIGFAVGTGVILLLIEGTFGSSCDCSSGALLFGVVVGAPVGGIIGLISGMKEKTWEEVAFKNHVAPIN